MRAAIGEIVAAGGADLATALLDECAAIAARNRATRRCEPPATCVIAWSRSASESEGYISGPLGHEYGGV
jgi:hypothetical protein